MLVVYDAGMRQSYVFRRTSLLIIATSAFLAGLACGRKWPDFSIVWLLLSGLLLVAGLRRRGKLLAIACLFVGLSLGWWRGASFRQQVMPYENLYGTNLVVRVVVKTDGVYEAKTRNLGFDAGNVEIISPTYLKLPGTLKIETMGLPAAFRGDRLQLTGKLYPSGGSRQGSIKFAKATLLSRHLSWLDWLRLRFGAAIQSALPEPQASFALGILVGQRNTLPADVSDQLSAVGLTHIIAVSGYNLTIMVRFAGKRLGRSKYQTLMLSFGLIATFVLITGFSASIVRAAMVSLLSLGAWYYGRAIKPLLILLLSGAISAAWNPVYVWSDIGWYLSFLAFFGVLMVAPLVTKYFWKGKEPRGLMPLVIESACAQAMAAPLIMHIFEETSLIALPANMVVVPLVPLAMLLAAAGGLAGMIFHNLGGWLAWPAKVLLGYMLGMVDWLSRTPHALVSQSLTMPLMLLFYGLVCMFCWVLWVKTKPRYGKITDEEGA